MAVVIACTCLCVPSIAAVGSDNILGVSVSPTVDSTDYSKDKKYTVLGLNRGDSFEFTIETPEFPHDSDAFHIWVDFDANVFEVESWKKSEQEFGNGYGLEGWNYNDDPEKGRGFLAVGNMGNSKDYMFAVQGGVTLKAKLRVKDTARVESANITLTIWDVSYYPDVNDPNYYVPMWKGRSGYENVADDPTNTVAVINLLDVPPTVADGGISATKQRVYNGEPFFVNVNVPLIAWYTEPNAFIRVRYDATRFELVEDSWDPEGYDAVNWVSGDDGYFGINLKEDQPELDKKFQLTAQLKAKQNAAAYYGTSDNFILEWQLDRRGVPGNSLWIPFPTSCKVEVTGYPLSDGGISPTETSVKRGTDFDVWVTIPAFSPEVAQKATSASFKVNFPASVFQVNDYSPKTNGVNAVPDNTAGTITFSASGLDFSTENVFTINMHALENASMANSPYDIRLTDANVKVTGDDRNGWEPADSKSKASITLYDDYNVPGASISLTKPYSDEALPETVSAGDRFDVVVKLPRVPSTSIDSLTFNVSYDYNEFDLLDSGTGHSSIGVTTTVKDGVNYLTFTKNSTGSLSLDEPITLRAHLQVTPDATGTHWFTLSDLTNVKIGEHNVWDNPNPYTTSVKISNKTNFAVDGGGLTAPEMVRQGERDFKVRVQIPELTLGADSIDLAVAYDTSVFTVTEWDLSGINKSYVDVEIDTANKKVTLKKKDGTSRIAISGAELTLSVTASDTAVVGSTHDFVLSPYSIKYLSKSGSEIDLWQPKSPDNTKKTVTIISDSTQYYSSEGGISVSPASVKAGDPVTVTVTVPKFGDISADNLSFTVAYKTAGFTLDPSTLSSSSTAFSSTYSTDDGTFTFALKSGQTVSLNSPITFTAVLTSKAAANGSYDFILSPYSIGSSEAGSGNVVWSPKTMVSATVSKDTIPSPDVFEPYTDGGIYISPVSVKLSGTFDVKVTIPALYAYVSDMDVMVTFDSDNFTCKSVSTSDTKNTAAKKYDGYYTLSLKKTEAELSAPITLTAKMQAKSNADLDWYDFDIYSYSIKGVPFNHVTTEELWEPLPANRTDSIEVVKSGGSGSDDPVPSSDFPVRGGGISLQRLYASRGDLVTVYVNVPAINAYATNGTITIRYNSSVFDVVSWDSYFASVSTGYGAGYLTMSLNNYSGISLLRGANFGITFKVNSSAAYGRYAFELVSAALRDSSYNDLWYPLNYSAYLTVSAGTYSNDGYYYPWPDPVPNPYPNPNPGWNNGGNNGGSNNGNNGNNGGNNGNNGNNGGNGQPIIDYLPDEMDIDPDDEDGITIDPGRRPDIKLTSDLESVNNGRIRAKTFSSFFGGDTIIYIRNTEEADRSAETALRTLRLSDHNSYAFDVSVYDQATGQYIHYLRNAGYIDLYIPVPSTMSGETGDIAVYHIQNGVPEPIDSIVVNDDGVRKIHFRANSFSPYMFVDLVNLRQADAVLQPDSSYIRPDNSNYPSRGNDNGGAVIINGDTRPANPHTGLAGWLVIPAGAAACVFLAKRDKKRKRSKRR